MVIRLRGVGKINSLVKKVLDSKNDFLEIEGEEMIENFYNFADYLIDVIKKVPHDFKENFYHKTGW